MSKPGPKPKEDWNLNLNKAIYGSCLSSVYVMTTGDGGSTKIGISDNPAARCAKLEQGFDREIRIYWVARLSRKDAFSVEQALHKSLRKTINHKRGEWYGMAAETARQVVLQEIAKQKVPWEQDITFGCGRLSQES